MPRCSGWNKQGDCENAHYARARYRGRFKSTAQAWVGNQAHTQCQNRRPHDVSTVGDSKATEQRARSGRKKIAIARLMLVRDVTREEGTPSGGVVSGSRLGPRPVRLLTTISFGL